MIVRQNDAKREAEQGTSEDAREHDAADRQGAHCLVLVMAYSCA